MYSYLSYSPWGSIQRRKTFQDGIIDVSTASHGGMMVRKDIAKQVLSVQARKKGFQYRDYLCYEEDCDWAIPVFELKHLWQKIFKNKTIEEIESILMKSLSLWNADYLLSIGVQPIDEYYQEYLNRQKEEEMLKNKHPDLIVAAWGDWHTGVKGVCQVVTADGKYHHVTEESYNKRSGLNLLSKCEIIARDIRL